MNFLRTASSFSFFIVLSRVTGGIRDWLVSFFLGATAVSDALIIAIKLPSFFRRLSAEGAFHNSFLPIFTRQLGPDKVLSPQAQKFCNIIFTLLAGGLFLFVFLVEGNFSYITQKIFNLHSPEKSFWVNKLGPIIFPYVFFISLASFFGSVLNAFGYFSLWGASNAIGNVTVILLVLGLRPWYPQYGCLFAWGILLSGVVQCGVMAMAFWRRGFRVYIQWPSLTPDVGAFFRRLGPSVLGVCLLQVNILLSLYFASHLPTGCISYLHYADRVNQLPVSILGVSISAVLLPTLLGYIKSGKTFMVQKVQDRVLRLGVAFILPITFMTMICAVPITFLLFGYGKLTPPKAYQVAYTLAVLASGMPAYIFNKILVTRFNAEGHPSCVVLASCLSIAVDMALCLCLMTRWQQCGIAAAISLSSWVNFACLLFLLHRKYAWRPSSTTWAFTLKLSLICALACGVVLGIQQFLLPPFPQLMFFQRLGALLGLIALATSIILVISSRMHLISSRHLRLFRRTILSRKTP